MRFFTIRNKIQYLVLLKMLISPKFSWRMIEHSQLSPVREEASRSVQMKNMCPAFLDVPMVDKDVDATWKKEMSDGKIIVAKDHYDVTDVCKNAKLNGGVFTGVMAFVMGVVTMTKMSKNLPRKAVDEHIVYFSNAIEKGQTPVSEPAVSKPEFSAVMKRLGELEEKVTVLSKKPVPSQEKEEMLESAVNRIEVLEAELAATKKALECALSRQNELLAFVEKKKRKKSRSLFSAGRWWPKEADAVPAGSK